MLAAAYVALPLMDEMTLRWFGRDLNARGVLVANALSDSVAEALLDKQPAKLKRLFTRTAQDERLFAIGVCDADGNIVQQTTAFPSTLSCANAVALSLTAEPRLELSGGPLHVSTHAVTGEVQIETEPREPTGSGSTLFGESSGSFEVVAPETAINPVFKEVGVGHLVILHDLSFIGRRSQDTRRYLIGFLAALGLVIALITMVVAQLSWRGWVSGVRAILRGEALGNPLLPPPELAPFVDELKTRLRDLEDEYRRSQGPEVAWTADRLRSLLHTQLRGDQVIVVSNREPYIHDRGPDGIIVRQPASGLVTAVEPVMRACSGTWIAHGSGTADRETVDVHDRVAVPPGKRRLLAAPDLAQRRGRARLLLRLRQRRYVAIVPRRTRASCVPTIRTGMRIARSTSDSPMRWSPKRVDDDPIVLVQDYHFALLPAMIREKLPQATILTFWHIPWPNPESFGICPWRREILQGMLGSTILGFHTRFHCKNFIETVDRYLEARIEHEHSIISCGDKETFWSRTIRSPLSGRRSRKSQAGCRSPTAGDGSSSACNSPPTSVWPWAWIASITPKASLSGSTP